MRLIEKLDWRERCIISRVSLDHHEHEAVGLSECINKNFPKNKERERERLRERERERMTFAFVLKAF